MKRIRILAVIFGLAALFVFPITVRAQENRENRPVGERPEASARRTQPAEPESPATSGVPAQGNQAAAPRLVKVSGVLTEFVRSSVEMTFAVYKDEVGGEALWTETQRVEVDKEGRYTVLLGAAQADGLPVELFPAGEPRWLGVEIRGQAPQSRTLLVSVPYAIKALDAEKLSGRSLSDLVLSENLGDQVRRVIEGETIVASQPTSTRTAQPGPTKASSTASSPTTAAGPMFPPSTFSGTNATQIVLVQQNGTGNGLWAQTASSTGDSGVVGVAASTSTSNNQNGVIGFNAGGGSGVAGIATNPTANANGVVGITNSLTGSGVYGETDNGQQSGFGMLGNATSTTGNAGGVGGLTSSPSAAAGFFFASNPSGSASGVLGVTNSPGGAGVIGVTNAASVGANGVYGKSISIGGNGVFGDATASSGFARGVIGQTASPAGDGVFGVANATSGFTRGVSGDAGASPNGTGVFGQTVQWVGVGGQATATSGTPAYGVWGDTASTSGAGVIGFADAPSGFSYGVAGNNASVNGIGVFGNATANSGSPNGVYGVSVSANGNGVVGVNDSSVGDYNNGVIGINEATSGNAYGVAGQTSTTGFGAGVIGTAFATSGTPFGVFGQSASPNAVAVFGHSIASSGGVGVEGWTEGPNAAAGIFVAHGGSGLILQGVSGGGFNTVFSVDANGNLNISGNLVVSGTKSSTAKLQNGREVALYAVESPENWFEDFGSAELKSGVAWVPLDPSFGEAANAALTYHVFLTPNGDSNGLYVARKTPTGFEVREQGGGSANIAFDYRIVVRRRGFESVRMAEVQHDVKTADASRQHLAQFVTSGVPKKAAAINPPRNIQAPAIRPLPARPIVPQVPKVNGPQAPKVGVPQPSQPR